jgi:hypothetical protein
MKPSPLRNEHLLERRRVTIFDKDCTKSTDSTRRGRLLIGFYRRNSLLKLMKKVACDTALKTKKIVTVRSLLAGRVNVHG